MIGSSFLGGIFSVWAAVRGGGFFLKKNLLRLNTTCCANCWAVSHGLGSESMYGKYVCALGTKSWRLEFECYSPSLIPSKSSLGTMPLYQVCPSAWTKGEEDFPSSFKEGDRPTSQGCWKKKKTVRPSLCESVSSSHIPSNHFPHGKFGLMQ